MNKILDNWEYLAVSSTALIPFIFAIKKLSCLGFAYKLIGLHSVFALIIEGVSFYLALFIGPNHYLFHIDTLLQGVCLLLFYFFLTKHKKLKYILPSALILLLLVELIEIIYVSGIFQYNSITRSYLSFIMSALSIYHLLKLRKNTAIRQVVSQPLFWFNAAILTYFSLNFLIFFFGFKLSQTSMLEFIFNHWIHLIILIVSRILFAIGFYKVPKTRPLWS